MERSENTLFMLVSADGKISTGATDKLDVDKDYPRIAGVREGLSQYYDLERQTDYWSLNTGKVMAKIGVNNREDQPKKNDVLNFIIIDSRPHLTRKGIQYLAKKLKGLYIATTNKCHPALKMSNIRNLKVVYYPKKVDFQDLFVKLRKEYGAERVTIQSGGTLNAALLRQGLIDHVSLVVAPALIGGKDTASLIGGPSLESEKELRNIKALELKKCTVLKHSYLHLEYDVINKTRVE